MPQKLEIMGSFQRDEDEAYRLSGSVEQAAAERTRPRRPKQKPDPFKTNDPGKPDPFSDVDLPKKQLPKKPDPFSDVE
jgi:hypothetical protein